MTAYRIAVNLEIDSLYRRVAASKEMFSSGMMDLEVVVVKTEMNERNRDDKYIPDAPQIVASTPHTSARNNFEIRS
jgi:hypothetical protein